MDYEIHRSLGRIEGEVKSLTSSVSALAQTLGVRLDGMEAEIETLKLDKAKAEGRWSAIAGAGAVVGALVSGILTILFH